MRTDKFKYIMDSMANHRIDEANSEYSASFLSESGYQKNRLNSQGKNANYSIKGNERGREHSTVEEVDEESMNSSRNNIGKKMKKKNSKDE